MSRVVALLLQSFHSYMLTHPTRGRSKKKKGKAVAKGKPEPLEPHPIDNAYASLGKSLSWVVILLPQPFQ